MKDFNEPFKFKIVSRATYWIDAGYVVVWNDTVT